MTLKPEVPAGRRGLTSQITLGRHQRLLKTSQFRAVYAARARAGDGRVVVYARPNGLGLTRLGLSVGKQVGNSVRRNRVKRLMREAFRHMRATFPAGYDIVIVPLPGEYSFEDVDQRLRNLVPAAIRRAGDSAGGRSPTGKSGG
jgi:ribonuclease P protein component